MAAFAFAVLAPRNKAVADHPLWEGRRTISSRFAQLPKNYWRYLAGVFAHGIGSFAPTLLILRASQILAPRLGFSKAAAISVGLYTFHNLIDAAAAYPAGALGDRIGKRGLLAAGYVIGVVSYAGFIFEQPTIPVLVVLFGLAGIHDAFQQSLEKSLAAELLPGSVRGTGFGVLATANGIGDFVSSVIVGAIWSLVNPAAGFLYAGTFTLLGAVLVYSSRGSGRGGAL
jgi:MFS family permease